MRFSVLLYVKILIPIETLDQYTCRAPIPFECECCGKTFYRPKNTAIRAIKGTKIVKYCSHQCAQKKRSEEVREERTCKCGKIFITLKTESKKSCSLSCSNSRPMSEEQKIKISLLQKGKTRPEKPKPMRICKRCSNTFQQPGYNHRVYCSEKCRQEASSERCKTIPGMCKNNNRHAGWYESLIAGRVWLESSWEVICAKILDKYVIEWSRPKDGFEWFDVLGRSHLYYPDFYLPAINLYLDPKNPFAQQRDAFKIADIIKRHGINLLILSKADIEESRFLALVSGAVNGTRTHGLLAEPAYEDGAMATMR